MARLRTAPVAVLTMLTLAAAPALFASPAGAAKKPPTITVLVTNDDGVAAPGLDALVEALRTVKNTKVVVVAPATNQSGTGGNTTPGTLVTQPATTPSGYAATAVQGFPADTVTAALDQLGVKPNVVMSGINTGQNLGPLTDLSGTIGAARMAAKRGIPAVAFSQGVGDPTRSTQHRQARGRRGWPSTAPRWRRSRRPRRRRSTTTTCRTARRASRAGCAT